MKNRKSADSAGKVRLLGYLRPYLGLSILAPLFMLGEVMVDLFQPKLMSKIVNECISENGDMNVIVYTGLIMLLLVAVGGFCGAFSSYLASRASQGFGHDLRRAGFNKVMSLSLQQTDRFTTGSLVTRLTNDITSLQDLVNMALRMFVRAPMFLIGGLVMCLALDVNFAYVMLISIPIQIIVVAIMLKKAHPMFSEVQKKLDGVNSVVQENVSGARVVKAYTREPYEISRFDRANTEYRGINYKVLQLMALIMPLLMIIMNLSVVAIIYVGGLRVEAQAINVGDVMAAAQYVTRVLMAVMMVSMIFQQAARGQASAQRVREVLSEAPAIVSGTITSGSSTGSIRFDNAGFAYPSAPGKMVISGVTIDIKQGETVAVIGSTGCGKSSLVNLIPRFYDCTEGSVSVDGVDVRDWDCGALRQKISFILQKSELFSGTVRDNIAWGKPEATDEEILRAAEIAQADEFVSMMPNKYYTYIAEKGASLSGGQKQRIAIARAVLRRPEIMIFDDSTSALDLLTESKLRRALRDNLSGTTVIMIAQRIASVKEADRIAVIENGTIAAFDTHENLMKSCPAYQDIYASQMKKDGEADGNAFAEVLTKDGNCNE